ADRVEVAAVNGPTSVVIAGDAEALDEALEVLGSDGVRVRRVAVDYASHTRHVEAIEDVLATAFADIRAQAPLIPFYSAVIGEWVKEADVLDGGYWYRNLRSQVRFGPAIADLLGEGYSVFVESSAHPVLVHPVSEIVDEADDTVRLRAVVAGSLRRGEGGPRRLLTSMAELFVRGVPVDWAGVLPAGAAATHVELPTYAFDHEHYWLRSAPAVDAVALGQVGGDHPLIGAVVGRPDSGGFLTTSRWSVEAYPWLGDHVVGEVVVVPSAVLVELAIRLGDEVGCAVVEELSVDRPVLLPLRGGRAVQMTVGEADGQGRRAVEVFSRADDAGLEGVWTRHAHGMLVPGPVPGSPSASGAVWPAGSPAAEVALDRAVSDADRYGLHPALLDAAVCTVLPPGMIATRWSGVALLASGAAAVRVRAARDSAGVSRLELVDATAAPVLTADAVVAEPFQPPPPEHAETTDTSVVHAGRRTTRQVAASRLGGLAEQLAATPPVQREQLLLDLIRREVASVLGHSAPGKVDPDRAFQEVGFDSVLAVELRNRLTGLVGIRLPATIIFDHPTPRGLMRRLLAELCPDAVGELAGREDEIRRVLVSTPLSRFQELGLMEKLLQLVASPGGEGATAPDTAGPEQDARLLIEEMDADDLVERAMRKAGKQ
ncbi:acyltransferase domain-containing protein, partial [Streptomyces asoensis]|uniref:acyltransferase domain-containing protein n=1 Tax=Streptomyces asoensis TaxID=249586 RepID=UPI0033C32EA4